MRVLTIILVILFFISSCKDKTEDPEPVHISATEVLIANEGNFGWGTGSLSLYDPAKKTVQQNVYASLNGEELGNVFQSIHVLQEAFYFVINNSQKIVITDSNYHKQGEINGFNAPRHIYHVGGEKAYVTDIYAGKIWIVSLGERKITGSIPFSGQAEEGLVHDGFFWVCNAKREYIYVVDIATDIIKDSIKVAYAPQSIVMDKEENIWVLSRGEVATGKKAALSKINPENKSLELSVQTGGIPVHLKYAPIQDKLYFLNEGICQLNVKSDSIASLFKSVDHAFLYALGVSRKSGEVYVGDAHDFVQQSSIYRYSAEGVLLDEFKAGIISTHFYFKE